MAQTDPLSRVLVGLTEDLEVAFLAHAKDGVIDATEIAHLQPHIRLVVVNALRVDLEQAAGLAVIRGGEDAQRASRLLHELQTWHPETDQAA